AAGRGGVDGACTAATVTCRPRAVCAEAAPLPTYWAAGTRDALRCSKRLQGAGERQRTRPEPGGVPGERFPSLAHLPVRRPANASLPGPMNRKLREPVMSDTMSTTLVQPARRLFLFETAALTLSGAAVALLAGAPRLAAANAKSQAESDLQILNAALAAEREAVAAYQVG